MLTSTFSKDVCRSLQQITLESCSNCMSCHYVVVCTDGHETDFLLQARNIPTSNPIVIVCIVQTDMKQRGNMCVYPCA